MLIGGGKNGDLEVNSETGVFEFVNRHQKVNFIYNIIVRNRGGTTMLDNGQDVTADYNPDLGIPNFAVLRQCGLTSTTIAPPALRTLWHSSEDAVAAEQTATFGNSNEVCPIRSISLREEDVDFSLARITNTYTVTLGLQRSVTMGQYEYCATAIAEGGHTAQACQRFWVTKTCLSEEVADARRAFVYNIPEFDQTVETFPQSIRNVISAPPSGCRQSYSWEMLDGSALPAELALDRNSGRFNLTNLASRTVDYRIKLVITNTGGSSVPYTGEGDVSAIYNSVHELEFHVKTECGLASTTLTPPNLRPLYSTPGF